MKVPTEQKSTGHWTYAWKRHKTQQKIIWAKWQSEKPDIPLPCKVILTRLGPRELDYVNAVYSLKWIQDQVADCIIPGLAKGRADGDKRITWQFNQEIAKIEGVRIQVSL